jgi:hypothetical protein
MKIKEYKKAGETEEFKLFGQVIHQKQYDDSIIVHFENEEEIKPYWKGKTIKYNNVTFYFGSSTRIDKDYIATFWKNNPVW